MNEEKTITSNENDKNEAIFNLIQNIQSKLNTELDNSETKPNEINNTNENLSNNEYENLNTNNTTNDNSSNSNFDISSIIGLLGNMNNSSNNDNSFNFGNLDPKLFSKIQKIVVTLGKKDPKKDLLMSLKPFLRKSRQDKIGEYITILTVIKAFEAFSDKGSDENE